jgi:hypothetical protein
MELIDSRIQRVEKWVLKSTEGLLYLAICITVFLTFYLIFGGLTRLTSSPSSYLPDVSRSSVGEGPLALTDRLASAELQSVLEQLILVGASTRPDQDHDQQLTLALRSTGEQKKVSIGETVPLETKGAVLNFSTEGADITLIPCSLESGKVFCKLSKASIQELCVLTPSLVFSRSLEKEGYVEMLKKGGVWSADVFLSGWGGEEYRDLKKKVKVSIGPDVFFLQPGDYLWWNGERWALEPESEKIGPIAQLIKASSQGVNFQVWDETGFSFEKIHLTQQDPSQVGFKIEELMTAIRPRASSEITCQLGKRRVIVKEGDWWIRMENRWKQLRTVAELDAFLHHQIPGELFIFEKVETSKGKIVLKGRAFDRMRTFSEPISLVVQTEKKGSPQASRSSKGNPAFLAKNRSGRPMLSNSSKEEGGL